MKTILITGMGHLGSCLNELLPEFGVSGKLFDGRIEDLTPEDADGMEAIVNTAGKADLAWCESNPREAARINSIEPRRMMARLRKSGIRLVQISSGCIWDGPYQDGRPLGSEAEPDPPSWYAWTKVMGEAMLEGLSAGKVTILRPRQVFSGMNHPRNALLKLLSYRALIDTPNSMTSARTIAETVAAVVVKGWWGTTMNVYNPPETTPYHVGVLLSKAGLRKKPARLDKSEMDRWHRPRRVDVVMSDPFFENRIQPAPIEGELIKAIRSLKRNLKKRVSG